VCCWPNEGKNTETIIKKNCAITLFSMSQIFISNDHIYDGRDSLANGITTVFILSFKRGFLYYLNFLYSNNQHVSRSGYKIY